MKKYEEISLIQTCGACPEQYNAVMDGEEIGYLRLRHGFFYAEHKGKRVYEAETLGDGIFDSEEREFHLKKAKKAIYKSILKSKSCT